MQLPFGHVFGTGILVKLFVPNIEGELYQKIPEAARIAAEEKKARIEATALSIIHTCECLDGNDRPLTSGLSYVVVRFLFSFA